MGRQAVHVQGVAFGDGQELFVDLKTGELATALGLFLFLTHGGPDVGDQQVGVAGGFGGQGGDSDAIAGLLHQIPARFKASRHGDRQLKIKLDGGVDIALAHVVAVANPGDFLALNTAAMLDVGLNVGQQLAGVKVVGQSVDHWHRGVLGEAFDNVVTEGAHHDDVDHGRHDPGAVFDRFAAPELGVFRGEEHGVAAHLGHAGLEGDAGAGGGFLKQHAEHVVIKARHRSARLVFGFHFNCTLYQLLQFAG